MIDCKITPASMGIIVKKWQNAQTTKISESSEFSSLIVKPYFKSMSNIKIITSGGDFDKSRQNPDAPLQEYCPSPILLPNYAGPQMRWIIAIVNAAVMVPAVEAKSSTSSSSLRQHSDNDTQNECLLDVEPCWSHWSASKAICFIAEYFDKRHAYRSRNANFSRRFV